MGTFDGLKQAWLALELGLNPLSKDFTGFINSLDPTEAANMQIDEIKNAYAEWQQKNSQVVVTAPVTTADGRQINATLIDNDALAQSGQAFNSMNNEIANAAPDFKQNYENGINDSASSLGNSFSNLTGLAANFFGVAQDTAATVYNDVVSQANSQIADTSSHIAGLFDEFKQNGIDPLSGDFQKFWSSLNPSDAASMQYDQIVNAWDDFKQKSSEVVVQAPVTTADGRQINATLIDNDALAQAGQALGDVKNEIANSVTDGFSNYASNVQQAGNSVTTGFSNAYDQATNLVDGASQSVQDAISGFGNFLNQYFDPLFNGQAPSSPTATGTSVAQQQDTGVGGPG